MFVIFILICLYKPRSFWVPGRPLEAPPPTEIQFSLCIFLELLDGSHHYYTRGGCDLRG